MPVAGGRHHQGAPAGADDRLLRHRQHVFPNFGLYGHIGEHVGLQDQLRIVQFHPHSGRAGRWVHGRIDEGQGSLKGASGQIAQFDGRPLPFPNPGKLVFVNIDVNPDPGQIGDGVEIVVRADLHPLPHHQLGDDALGRRMQAERLVDLPGCEQAVDLGRRDIPKLQPAAGCLEQIFAPLGQIRVAAFPGGIPIAGRQQQFLLGGNQLRGVDFQQGLAALHQFALVLHEQALHPALNLGVDMLHQALVVAHPAHRPHLAGQIAPRRRGDAHAHALHQGGVDADAAARHCPFAGANRHQIHAHGALARRIADVAGVHGRLPVQGRRPAGADAIPAGLRGRRIGLPPGPPAAAGRDGGQRQNCEPMLGPHRRDAPRLASMAAKAMRRSAMARSSRSWAFSSRTWLSIRSRKLSLFTA